MKKFLYLIIFAAFSTLNSCDESITCPGMEEHNDNAVLRWTGDYVVDGCGFIIEIDQVTYKAENENVIGEHFKSDVDVNISITYETSHDEKEMTCGDSKTPTYWNSIRIISIEKK